MNYNKYLEDLEARIDPQVEDKLYKEWKAFADGNWNGDIFSPSREYKSPPKIEWPIININDAIIDDDLMIIGQFAMCSSMLEHGSGSIMWVRSNYGVGIIPSLYGVSQFVMPYEMNTLPNVYPLESGIDDIKRAIDTGIPNLNNGWGEKVFTLGEKYMEIKKRYPKIAEYVRIDHPDCQGPMDVCELLWSSSLFVDLYDKPELVHTMLNNITDTYIAFLEKWFSISHDADDYHTYFGSMHRGGITVRDDSAMNLSPAMFDEFIYPYDQKVLSHFDGGCIHYCGRGDHFIERTVGMKGLTAINLSQPHLNDMNKIFDSTVNQGINIISLRREAAETAIANGRNLKGLVHA